jgi:hypothetical protein
MLISSRRLSALLLGAAALAAPLAPGRAQQGNNVLGPPQIRDFQLPGERRTPPAQPQAVAPASTTNNTQPAPASPTPSTARTPSPEPRATAPVRRPEPAAPQPQTQAQPRAPAPEVQAAPAPQPEPQVQPAPVATPAPVPQPEGGSSWWLYLLPLALAGLGAAAYVRARRVAAAAPEPLPRAQHSPPPAVPPKPRPDPVPRPWLELELKAERAASTLEEARVDFEMVIHNSGKSPARNIRINARMFNAGRTQDEEIGAFFKTKGEGRRTHTIPELPGGESGLIQGSVTMPRDELRALQVNNQALFIPVVGVNLVYDWGNGRTGQTSKSYVIGRELGAESEKMGAFRLDAGPRIYRAVGQRAHSLARRV